MSFTILLENQDILAVSKPHGIDFHGEKGVLAELRNVRPEIYGIHRLDKETSGVMVFAKSKSIQSELSKAFAQREVKKVYMALSVGKPSKKQGMVKGDLVKSRGGSYKLTRALDNPSVTKFKSFYLPEIELRAFILMPLTGKTHQLRVVLKSLGSPILGDKRYGGAQSERMYLHAYRIKFTLAGQDYLIEDYPRDELFLQEKELILDSVKEFD